MLIEFSVGNYRSFYAPMTISMEATKLRANEKKLDEHSIFECGNLSLLRSAAIYGANASGKSNLIQAIAFMKDFVLKSAKDSQAGEPIEVRRFGLNSAARQEPASFQIIFHLDGKRYRYGFELDDEIVQAEWLYHTAKRETRLFMRQGDQFELKGAFAKEGRGLEARTRDNALFLSVVAQFNGTIATALLKWFRTKLNVISGLSDEGYTGFTLQRFENDDVFRKRVLDFIRLADVGITDMLIEHQPLADASIPDELRKLIKRVAEKRGDTQDELSIVEVKTIHPVFDREHNLVKQETFDMKKQESGGTQKIFSLSGPILDTLEKGKILAIDEIEARLHPLLTLEIVRLFNSPQTNPHNAQLIFATHDTGLLGQSLLRRDQIWFTEKDKYGATDLYSLAELNVRNDASYDKHYVIGRYGAIPFAGGLRILFEEMAHGTEA